jgi:saccharopine dehydrogenase (NAD+, L-lysine-forming)
VVVNLAGPYYKTAGPVLQACKAEKVHYVDVADDAAATRKLLGYHQECEEAGITALICYGASPGLSNVLCMLGASQMDEVDELHTLWVQSVLEDTTGAASIWHGLEMVNGTVGQFLDGELKEVPALSGGTNHKFGEGLDEWPVYYVGHPEPITLPDYVKGVKKVVNMGNLWPQDADLLGVFGPYRDMGLTNTETLAVGDVEISKRDFACANIIDQFTKALEANVGEDAVEEAGTHLRVDVLGKKGGRPSRISYQLKTVTKEATGCCAAYAAQSIAKDEITSKGVHPPEAITDPSSLLQYLAERGFSIIETKTETKPL